MKKETAQTSKVHLIVEKKDGNYWGRVSIKGNLVVDVAKSVKKLAEQLKELIAEEFETPVEAFEISYDLTSFFSEYPYLDQASLAREAKISHDMMRQYASGAKFPSEERVKQIEEAIHRIGQALIKVTLHKPEKRQQRPKVPRINQPGASLIDR